MSFCVHEVLHGRFFARISYLTHTLHLMAFTNSSKSTFLEDIRIGVMFRETSIFKVLCINLHDKPYNFNKHFLIDLFSNI